MEHHDNIKGVTVGEIIVFITILGLVLVIGSAWGANVTENRMLRQSLQGYTATAEYKTNSVGEVSIQCIRWAR